MKHAYIKLERSGAVSIRWWVDSAEGLAARTILHVLPGETAFDLSFEEWKGRAGQFVDLDEIQHHALVRPRAN